MVLFPSLELVTARTSRLTSRALSFSGRPERGFQLCRGSPDFNIRQMIGVGTPVRSLISEEVRSHYAEPTLFALWDHPIQYRGFGLMTFWVML